MSLIQGRSLGVQELNHRIKEREIRKAFVEQDVIEGVILLPGNLFYNTSAPGIILLLNRNKPSEHKGQFLLVNVSAYFVKEKPKNVLTDEGITAVAEVYRRWETREKLSKLVTLEQLREADYNLSPSQFVEINGKAQHRLISEILEDLAVAKVEREQSDAMLENLLSKLLIQGEDI